MIMTAVIVMVRLQVVGVIAVSLFIKLERCDNSRGEDNGDES